MGDEDSVDQQSEKENRAVIIPLLNIQQKQQQQQQQGIELLSHGSDDSSRSTSSSSGFHSSKKSIRFSYAATNTNSNSSDINSNNNSDGANLTSSLERVDAMNDRNNDEFELVALNSAEEEDDSVFQYDECRNNEEANADAYIVDSTNFYSDLVGVDFTIPTSDVIESPLVVCVYAYCRIVCSLTFHPLTLWHVTLTVAMHTCHFPAMPTTHRSMNTTND